MKKTAFITGSGGFICSETARRLSRDGYAIARRLVRGFCDYDADIPAYRAARRELLEELSGIASSPLPQSQGAQGSQHLDREHDAS